jgi:dTDP-6-deoxy-L-talose 4-dehydrogenase (NAD+)
VKILITGAGGYIGRHVVREALSIVDASGSSAHEVVVCDYNRKYLSEDAEVLDIDIFKESSDIFKEAGSPDLLLHLAWQDGFVHNSKAHMLHLSDHVRFINGMIAGGLKNVAVMGSMHEVGYWEGAIDESTPCNPLTQYGIAKNALRESLLIGTASLDVNLYWLRAFYIYGDDVFGSSVFSKLAIAAGQGKEKFPFTTGKNKYDFIHIADLAKQIVAASTQDTTTGIINVCSGKPVSLADQLEQYIKDNNYNIELEYGAFPDRPYDSPAVWGDSTKIQSILGNTSVTGSEASV